MLESVQDCAAHWVYYSHFDSSIYMVTICPSSLSWPPIHVPLITLSLLLFYGIMKQWTSISCNKYFQFNCNSTHSHPRTLVTQSSIVNAFHYSL